MIKTTISGSDLISEVGWESETLYITFKRGATYKYMQVSLQTYNELVAAESVGRYFHQKIGKNYPFEPVSGGIPVKEAA